MTNSYEDLVTRPGQEVLVVKLGSPMRDRIGEAVGPADDLEKRRVRVNFDGHIYVFYPEDLKPI